MPPSVSVLIPAYNEAATIGEILRRAIATGVVSEIIVVDDGSQDGTDRRLEEASAVAALPVRIAQHRRNRGKGAAIRTALELARGELVLIQDADLEYDPADYAKLLAPFSDPQVVAVFGSRNRGRNPKSSWAFYWGGRYLSWLANLLFGGRLTDVTTGYKVVRAEVMRAVDLREDGFDFCVELAAKLLRRGIEIREVPIAYRPRSRAAGKKIRVRHGLTATWTLLKLRLQR